MKEKFKWALEFLPKILKATKAWLTPVEIAKELSERVPFHRYTSSQARWLIRIAENEGLEVERKQVSKPILGCKTLYRLA